MARKVLISAGGSGIGRCIAEVFLNNNDEVLFVILMLNALNNFNEIIQSCIYIPVIWLIMNKLNSCLAKQLRSLAVLIF